MPILHEVRVILRMFFATVNCTYYLLVYNTPLPVPQIPQLLTGWRWEAVESRQKKTLLLLEFSPPPPSNLPQYV